MDGLGYETQLWGGGESKVNLRGLGWLWVLV